MTTKASAPCVEARQDDHIKGICFIASTYVPNTVLPMCVETTLPGGLENSGRRAFCYISKGNIPKQKSVFLLDIVQGGGGSTGIERFFGH